MASKEAMGPPKSKSEELAYRLQECVYMLDGDTKPRLHITDAVKLLDAFAGEQAAPRVTPEMVDTANKYIMLTGQQPWDVIMANELNAALAAFAGEQAIPLLRTLPDEQFTGAIVELIQPAQAGLREALNVILECVSRMRWQIARLPNNVRDESFERDLEQLMKAAHQGEYALTQDATPAEAERIRRAASYLAVRLPENIPLHTSDRNQAFKIIERLLNEALAAGPASFSGSREK